MIHHRLSQRGFTFLEIIVLMLILAIALVPILATSGGFIGGNNATSTLSGVIKDATNADIIANSILQIASSGQIPSGDNLTDLIDIRDTTLLPRGGYYRSPRRFNYDANGRFQYEWELRDLSYPYLIDVNGQTLRGLVNPALPSEIAVGNRMAQAKVTVYDSLNNPNTPAASYSQII
ncbi:MAG: hypothetical protein VKK59_05075, partial [Vampirovibrionales bacterium]|nr:hypothetical protein [Vampirovibrionales bacterium]